MQHPLGDFGATIELRDDGLVAAQRAPIAPNLPDLAAAIREALEQPRRFPPLRRALTPDDRVAVVVDDRLPQAGALVSELLAYLTEAGVNPAAITLVSAPGSRQNWVEELPDSVQDVRTEIHDPTSRTAFSYLASTRAGRRVYLNRTVVEADQSVVLAGCRFDATLGIHDGATALFPILSDTNTRDKMADLSAAAVRAEATEVAWLVGVPFLVHVVDGVGDGVAHIVGGTIESAPDCEQLLHQRWHVRFDRPAQTVVATLTGDPAGHDFETLTTAAHAAAGVVEPGGRIVLLSRVAASLPQAFELLRDTDNPAVAMRRLQEHRPPGHAAAQLWLDAARHASLYLLSNLPGETVEELFATPLQHARQTQKLIDPNNSCLLLEDAHRVRPTIE